jgi:hypothetical protein
MIIKFDKIISILISDWHWSQNTLRFGAVNKEAIWDSISIIIAVIVQI